MGCMLSSDIESILIHSQLHITTFNSVCYYYCIMLLIDWLSQDTLHQFSSLLSTKLTIVSVTCNLLCCMSFRYAIITTINSIVSTLTCHSGIATRFSTCTSNTAPHLSLL